MSTERESSSDGLDPLYIFKQSKEMEFGLESEIRTTSGCEPRRDVWASWGNEFYIQMMQSKP